jgi:hypothetical protein
VQIKRYIYLALLVNLISSVSPVYSQNLVLNSSFEDTLTCSAFPPTNYPSCSGSCITPPWFEPLFGSSDYYNYYWATSCGFPGAGNPNYYNNGSLGYQFPKSGNGMLGIGCFAETVTDSREFIEGRLTGPLIQGHEYCVEFHASLINNSGHAIRNVGAFFSEDSLLEYSSDFLNLGLIPHIQPPSGIILSDTMNWMLVSGVYTASGGEKYITIGNFMPDSLTDKNLVTPGVTGTGWNYIAYYLIDDVSVIDCTVGLAEHDNFSQLQFSPNPTTGEVQFDLEIRQNAMLEVLDVTGRVMYTQELNKDQNRHLADLKDVVSGCYLVSVKFNGTRIASGKIFKIN